MSMPATSSVIPLPCRRMLGVDVSLSVLGFGASSIGNLYRPMSHVEATKVLRHAQQLGIEYIDTAPHYGQGLSERRIGIVRPRAVISTKVGRLLFPIDPPPPGTDRHGFIDADPFEAVFDYSYDGVMRSFAESCRRLGRESIDILLAHDLGKTTHGEGHAAHLKSFLDGGYRAMMELKTSGRVGAIGLGVNEYQVCEEIMPHASLDVVLLAGRYTLLEQGALNHFLPACEAQKISVVVGGPYNSGVLVDRDRYDYKAVPAEIASRVARLKAVCRAHNVPLAAAALQFPLAHPSVVSVLPGMGSAVEVESNLHHMTFHIPSDFWVDLREANLLHPEAPTPASAPIDASLYGRS